MEFKMHARHVARNPTCRKVVRLTMRASGPRAAAAAGAELAESPSAALPDSRSGWSSQRARAAAPGLKLELQLAASSGLELGLELGLERARKPLARAGFEIYGKTPIFYIYFICT